MRISLWDNLINTKTNHDTAKHKWKTNNNNKMTQTTTNNIVAIDFWLGLFSLVFALSFSPSLSLAHSLCSVVWLIEFSFDNDCTLFYIVQTMTLFHWMKTKYFSISGKEPAHENCRWMRCGAWNMDNKNCNCQSSFSKCHCFHSPGDATAKSITYHINIHLPIRVHSFLSSLSDGD